MQVLQQPQRARACGSGAKSSADRRPVDPPPVVELKIYDAETRHDLTFAHNANFFLYTTLESARAIAPIRGSSVPAPYPVLTGTPVAGMAYLDRPVPAGYFIFPDLSVRHEGKYRLSFNLYEELKEERDRDLTSGMGNLDSNLLRSNPMAPRGFVHFRLEVKSEPFIVYSAKKFPGLAESTNLSRVVAEQGCRVRIRRDVRMRRRDNKSNKDLNDFEDDVSGYPADRYSTPDAYGNSAVVDRNRSGSTSSVADPNGQFTATDRRASGHDQAFFNQPTYQQPPLQTPVPQQAINFNSHLTFGSAPQYQTPMPNNASQVSQPALSFSQQQPSGHSRHASSSSNFEYPTSQSFQQPSFTQHSYQAAIPQRSIPEVTHPNEPSMYPAIDRKFIASSQPYFTQNEVRSTTPSNPQQMLPPLKTIQPLGDRSMSGSLIASSPSTGYEQSAGPYSFSPNQMTPARNTKRVYERVFDTSHYSAPVADGSRSDAVGQDILQIDTEESGLVDEEEFAKMKMLSYRRADGSQHHKKIPSPVI